MADRLARGLVCAWALVAVEWAVVGLSNRRALASVWELQYGTLWLAPTALGLAGIVGLAGAAALALFESTHPLGRWALGALAAACAAATGWGVTTGRHFAQLPRRLGFVMTLTAVAAAVVVLLVPRLRRLRLRHPARFALAVAVGVGVVEVANRFVLVRLYPAFHWALALSALALASWVQVAWTPPEPRPGRVRRWIAFSLGGMTTLGCLVVARPAAARLAYFDNLRWIWLEHAPLIGQAVVVAAKLAPPAPLSSGCEGRACGGTRTPPRSAEGPDLRGRDVLLISIDALRADHVGAYGYERASTPHVDRLARQGVVFDRAYCPTPHTSYSVVSMMTGKYIRPLLLQGTGGDSETWAELMRTYGYKTGAFYPPAVFFIDRSKFAPFERSGLGFEYRKVEFIEGPGRVRQVERYLADQPPEERVFLWVHLFGPHEPYEKHPAHDFGDRDVDRYDSEIAAADETVGRLVELVRRRDERAVVIVTSDHGEEFRDHGGRYHGTTVYEEQVRVPLIIAAPGALEAHRIGEPVQTIDLLPTLLASLKIPKRPRIRGRDLGPLLIGDGSRGGEGMAFAETAEATLFAEGSYRLICERRVGACRLYDIDADPAETRDRSRQEPDRFARMRRRLHELGASHGRFEADGLRAEGRGWPAPILRGLSGDADAAHEVASLLDDADPAIRRKAAEVLFELGRPDTAPALRLALGRDEDPVVRRWAALALTRLGEGAPLVNELVESDSLRWRRLAALALAESGDRRGERLLIDWWMSGVQDHQRAMDLLDAFARIESKDAVFPLLKSLDRVRLRPHIAHTLAAIGDDSARGPLAVAFREERYQTARQALAEALVELGAEGEIARPLVRFLGVPDPLPEGVRYAMEAGIYAHVGGPASKRQLDRLKRDAHLGAAVRVVIPKAGNGRGVRAIVRARSTGAQTGEVRLGRPVESFQRSLKGEPKRSRNIPTIDDTRSMRLTVPRSAEPVEVYAPVPDALGAAPGRSIDLVVYAERGVELTGLALVPLADELPPPAPEPWSPDSGAPATAE